MNQKFLLVSDLDDTLLGDNEALARFRKVYESFESDLAIAYASGRFYSSIEEDVCKTDLPEPVAVIGGVGSEIHSFPEGELNKTWAERIANDWCDQTVQRALVDEVGLKLQPAPFQSRYKVSYFLSDASSFQLKRIEAKLFAAGVNVNLIYSSKRDLDVLPGGVNKGTAAVFLAQQQAFNPDRVIVAGNSGNDLCMFEHDFSGIVVANGHEDLKSLRGQRKVHIASTGYADGVTEGLRYWLDRWASLDTT